jgi:hypothetical protein
MFIITHKINLPKVKSKASAFKPMIFPEFADCFFGHTKTSQIYNYLLPIDIQSVQLFMPM